MKLNRSVFSLVRVEACRALVLILEPAGDRSLRFSEPEMVHMSE